MRVCILCKTGKPETAFEWTDRRSRRRTECRKCRRARPCAKLAKLRSRLKQEFGLTLDQYEQLLRKQNGLCAICHQACKTGRRLAVDHDHNTGEVRGLLCGNCNRGLGMFNDNVVWLNRAIAYVSVLKAGADSVTLDTHYQARIEQNRLPQQI